MKTSKVTEIIALSSTQARIALLILGTGEFGFSRAVEIAESYQEGDNISALLENYGITTS